MSIRYDEDAGQYFRYSEDEPPEVVYRDPDGENWLTQAQYDQLLAQEAAAASAAAEAEAARMAPFASAFSKPVVSYSGALSTLGQPSGQYEFYMRDSSVDEDGDRTTNFYKDTGSGQIFYYDPEENSFRPHLVGEDNDARYAPEYQDSGTYSYDSALKKYSSGYQPWNWQNIYEGLSDRTPFNLNALWGGTQYAAGRVTDYSHIDPSQYEANLIASNARNELWNVYDQLRSQGKAPEKNPDQLALDFYVKNVGPQGHTFGYGPGANTVLVTEALKNQFLNQPSVVAATGSTYQTPPETLQYSQQFGTARQAGVPTWQVFEQQGYSKDWLGSLMPMIIGSMAFPGLSAAFGGGALGAAGAGALIGGVTSEIGGGDFLKGALTGALGGGLTSGLSGVSSYLQSAEGLGLSKAVADAVVSAGARAITAGATGGDVEQAILSSLVGSGVSGVAGEYLPPDIAKVVAPVVSTALLGGDVESALLRSGLSYLKDASWGVNQREAQDAGEMIGDESPFALDDAEIGAGVDLTGGTGMPIKTDFDLIVPSSPYEGLEGYTPEVISQLEQGIYSGPEQTEAEVKEQLGDLYDVAYPSAPQPITTSPYEGLEGYTPEVISQLEQGTYAGPEQTEAEVREQLGDLYDVAYPEGIPTSSSPYEGLGYDANLINQLMEGPSATLNEDGTYTYGGYSGPEQTEEEIREQMGDLYDVAYPGWTSGYDLPSGETTGTTGGTSSTGGSGGTGSGGSTSPTTTTRTTASSSGLGALQRKEEKTPESSSVVWRTGVLPGMISTGNVNTSPSFDYAALIPQLANIFVQRKMRSGGSVHVPGPEGRFYEKHAVRGFAVGGPGTGQSDDIPTMLSDGEYVFDADTVAALGDGSSKAGAEILDKFREEVRRHKRSAPADRIPPKAKNPLAYLKAAQKAKG